MQIDAFRREDTPGQRDQPVQVTAAHGILRRRGGHAGQTSQFPVGFLARFFRHSGSFDFLPQLFDFALVVVAFSKFTLDRAQLFPQEIFALALSDFFLNLALDLAAQFENFEFLGKFGVKKVQAFANRGPLEDKLLRNDRKVRKIGRDVVGKTARIFHIDDDRLQVIRQLRRQLDDAFELADDCPPQRLEVDAVLVFLFVLNRLDLAAQVGLKLGEFRRRARERRP